MNWKQLLRDRILGNLASAPVSQKAKDEIVAEAIEATEAYRHFGETEDEERKKKARKPIVPGPLDTAPVADPITSRNEKMSDLRKAARRWGGWEPWNS